MRLVTRSDFDGLVCAILLRQVMDIESIQFVHPKDLQDGKFTACQRDVLANVPYVPGCGLWFDHHATERERVVGKTDFQGECRLAPSAARVVYDYFGGKDRFGDIDEMMREVDKADSAGFSAEEILNPEGWVLLSFVMDARTGLGRFKDYRISNYQLMYDLIEACSSHTIDEVLKLPDVQERVARYLEHAPLFQQMIREHTTCRGSVIVTDLRDVYPIYAGNRFMVYALYPEQNCSMWIVNGLNDQNTVFACGHSILNPSSRQHIGALMRLFEGGGHKSAGTCQVANDIADSVRDQLILALNAEATEVRAAA